MVGILLTIALVVVSAYLWGGSPPSKIVLATGQPGGVYDSFGREYQKRLGAQGLKVELVNTAGSVDNFRRIIEGKVDIAFAQSGTYQVVNDPQHKVSGLAAIYYEPLWIFTKRDIRMEDRMAYRPASVAVGPKGSGTEAIAKAIIAEQGYDITAPAIVNLSSADARRQLIEGKLDVAFFVTSYRDGGILELLRQKNLRLTSFRREVAYTRKFRGLTPVKVPEGLLDLKDNIPSENITLLSPSALLVARDTINPRLVELVLKVAQAVHGPGDLLDPPLKFPSLEGVDVPINEAAETYLTSGESFLSRNLPYRALRWVLLLKLLLLPLLAVWLPLLRLAPMIASWRKGRWLKRYYARLRDVEGRLATAQRPDELREGITELEALRGEVQKVSRKLPLQQQQDIYHWRLHVQLILNEALERLGRMETAPAR
ncbi:MAG TPA: TAXI family TRAP transporter solute-binding subunit [Methylomirabilota bacterium]